MKIIMNRHHNIYFFKLKDFSEKQYGLTHIRRNLMNIEQVTIQYPTYDNGVSDMKFDGVLLNLHQRFLQSFFFNNYEKLTKSQRELLVKFNTNAINTPSSNGIIVNLTKEEVDTVTAKMLDELLFNKIDKKTFLELPLSLREFLFGELILNTDISKHLSLDEYMSFCRDDLDCDSFFRRTDILELFLKYLKKIKKIYQNEEKRKQLLTRILEDDRYFLLETALINYILERVAD